MKSYLLLPFALFSISTALAFPKPDAGSYPSFTADGLTYDFEGMVAMSECSGSLVRFDDSQDTDPALVLSNGHCTAMIEPGKVILNQKASDTFRVLGSAAIQLGTVNATRLLYATMTKTDISLYQTRETYAEIRSRFHVEALTLSREAPMLGAPIEVLSGYWKQGYSCSVAALVGTLKEGDWTFQDSIRYTESCETFSGTSGSPVLAAGTRTVIAVHNTVNSWGGKCTENNPCEIQADGSVIYKRGYNYAQQTYWLYTCRNKQGQLDVQTPGCQLPHSSERQSPNPYGRVKLDANRSVSSYAPSDQGH